MNFKSLAITLFCFLIASLEIFSNAPIILRHADELIGQSDEMTNTRTLRGNVRLQQNNVYVTCDSAIQYLNTNKFLLIGNVVIKQETLTLKSHSVLYDGNSYLAKADNAVHITDKSNKLVGKRGTYSTNLMIANFYDEVILEDDSVKIFANFITYNRETSDSKAIGDVTVQSKNQNIFLQADTINNFPNSKRTIARGNPVLFQIDTIWQNNPKPEFPNIDSLALDTSTVDSFAVDFAVDISNVDTLAAAFTLDTLSIKSDTMFAFREAENEHYIFIGNVEFVKKELKAKSAQSIYYVADEKIILYSSVLQSEDIRDFDTVDSATVENFNTVENKAENFNTAMKINEQAIVWLDSTQLHSDSIVVKLEDSKLKNIYAFNNCIAISLTDTINLSRIDQLAGNEIILHIENDTLRKIESIGNARSVFFSESNDEPDGVIEATAEKIIIMLEDGKAENIYLIKQIPGKYHPEPFVRGIEKNFYLPNFKKSDDIPIRPEIRNFIQ